MYVRKEKGRYWMSTRRYIGIGAKETEYMEVRKSESSRSEEGRNEVARNHDERIRPSRESD